MKLTKNQLSEILLEIFCKTDLCSDDFEQVSQVLKERFLKQE